MDIQFLTEYAMPMVVGLCLCVGYLIKQSLPFISNQYIPLIVAVLGVGANIWIYELSISPDIVLGGLVSGLVSTGCYEMFRNLLEGYQKGGGLWKR